MQGFFSTPFLFFTICFYFFPCHISLYPFLSSLLPPFPECPTPSCLSCAPAELLELVEWPCQLSRLSNTSHDPILFSLTWTAASCGKGRLNTSGNLQLNSSVTAWTKVMMIAGSCSHCAIVKTTQDYFLRHSIASGNIGRMGHQTSSYCCCEFHLNLLY